MVDVKRGWHRPLTYANPLIRRTAIIIDQVTTATQIRGFGSAQVTAMTDLHLAPLDRITIVVFIAGFVAAVLGVIFFKFGLI